MKPAPQIQRKAFAASKTEHSQKINKKPRNRTLSLELTTVILLDSVVGCWGGGVSMCNFFTVKYGKHSRENSDLKKKEVYN